MVALARLSEFFGFLRFSSPRAVKTPPGAQPFIVYKFKPWTEVPPGWHIFGLARFQRSVKKLLFSLYFLYWLCINLIISCIFRNFFLSQIPWFSVYFLQGLSPNHIIPCTKSMVQIPAGVFSYGRATRLFFLFHVLPVQVHGWSSYFCKLRPASISLWMPTLGTDIFTDISVP